MIIIDSNERPLVEDYLKEEGCETAREPLKEDNLGLGDYTNDKRTFIVERKTAFDYRGSLVKNHLQSQLARMNELFDGPKFLIFEGDFEALIDSEKDLGIKNWMKTFRLKLAHVYGVMWIECLDALETAQMLMLLDGYAEHIKDPKVSFEPIYVKKTKDERVRNLMTVPRLGQAKAELLLQKYKSINAIVTTALNNPKDLLSIEGIGKTLVQKIVDMYTSDNPFLKNKKNDNENKVDRKDEMAKMKKRIAAQRDTYNKNARGGNRES